MDELKTFNLFEVYIYKDCPEMIFVCVPCYGDAIGKIVQYKKNGDMWEKTGNTFFLNFYFEGELKALFLNRDNYDVIGKIGVNSEFSQDEEQTYLMRTGHGS